MQEDVLIKKYFYNLNYIVLCEMYLNEYLKPDVIEEKDLKGDILVRTIDEVLNNPDKIKKIKANLQKESINDSASRIYDCLKNLVDRK